MYSASTPNKSFTRQLLALAIIAVCAAQSSHGQEAQNISERETLEMVYVVGQATSGIDSLVTQEDLENMLAGDLSDIFALDPAVSVGGSVGMGQKLYVRNTGEDLLNISVDGAEQAGAVFHHSGRVAIEPELLKRVEVEAGAGSATAGPGAIGGSIKFATKDPEDLLDSGENIGALVKATHYNNGNGLKTSATIYGKDRVGVLSAMASYVGSDVENLDDGDGKEILGTESEKRLGYAKVVANITKEQFVSLSYEGLSEEGNILYKPELVASERNVAEPTEGKRSTLILNYSFDSQSQDAIDFSMNIYSTELEQEREFRGTSYDGAVETLGLTLQNKSQVANHQLIYGVNYRDDKSTLNDVDIEPFFFEETGEVIGLFFQDVVEFSKRLTISAGVRFDDYELLDVESQTISDSGVSPNLSANYEFVEGFSLSVGYAEAFRGPEVKDSFKLSTSTNAVDLEAETAKNMELGLDFVRENFKLAVGIYSAVIENPVGGVVPWSRESINLEDDIETEGVFTRFDVNWDKLTLSVSYNHADTEAGGEIATRYVYSSGATTSGDTLVLDISYDFTNDFIVGWVSEWVEDINDISIDLAGEQLVADKPGYDVHDLFARWTPAFVDGLDITLTAKNIFNEQYLNHGSVENFEFNPGYEGIVGSAEPGRDIRVSAAFSF